MITLTLLHPLQDIPVQSWSFSTDSTIRIGRSSNNEVVLFSAVVSRHHVQLEYENNQWQIANVGSNGTYINDQRIERAIATDGLVMRLANGGPKIQIKIDQGDDENSVIRRKSAKARNLGALANQTLVR